MRRKELAWAIYCVVLMAFFFTIYLRWPELKPLQPQHGPMMLKTLP